MLRKENQKYMSDQNINSLEEIIKNLDPKDFSSDRKQVYMGFNGYDWITLEKSLSKCSECNETARHYDENKKVYACQKCVIPISFKKKLNKMEKKI